MMGVRGVLKRVAAMLRFRKWTDWAVPASDPAAEAELERVRRDALFRVGGGGVRGGSP
jgi:hypothetical protein